MRRKSAQSASVGEANKRRQEELTNREDELVLEFCGYDSQHDGQTQCRGPERKVLLVAKQTLGRIPIVLESTFLIHPNRDFESAQPLAFRIYLVSFRFGALTLSRSKTTQRRQYNQRGCVEGRTP